MGILDRFGRAVQKRSAFYLQDVCRDKVDLRDIEIDELKKQLIDIQKLHVKLIAEHDVLFLRLQRLQADFSNYQKNATRRFTSFLVNEKEQIVKTLLPVFDDFDLAFDSLGITTTNTGIVDGFRLIHSKFLSILTSMGVEEIDALGKEFDPVYHEAVQRHSEVIMSVGSKCDYVLKVLCKGYTFNGRVLRAAKVLV